MTDVICKYHPRYQAKRPPRSRCVGCFIRYLLVNRGHVQFYAHVNPRSKTLVELEAKS